MYGGYDDQGDMSVYAPYSHGNPKNVDLEELKELTLADYGWTPEALKAYMYGVRVIDPETGEELGDAFYTHALETAITKAEKQLDIVILPRIVTEHHDYNQSDFNSYMYTHTHKKPVIQVENFKLEFNGRPIYNYPSNWWKVYHRAGHVELYPTANMQTGTGLGYEGVFNGYPQLAGMPPQGGRTFAPQMIHIKFVAGMLPRKNAGMNEDWEVPPDLEQLVLKYALKEIFQVWGRLIIGAGVASRSLVVDGISESVDTTQSAMYQGASADLILIDQDINELLAGLKSYYGFNMGII